MSTATNLIDYAIVACHAIPEVRVPYTRAESAMRTYCTTHSRVLTACYEREAGSCRYLAFFCEKVALLQTVRLLPVLADAFIMSPCHQPPNILITLNFSILALLASSSSNSKALPAGAGRFETTGAQLLLTINFVRRHVADEQQAS